MSFVSRLVVFVAALAASMGAVALGSVAPDGGGDDFAPRIVVKFRVPPKAGETGAARIARLAAETGLELSYARTMAIGASVVTAPSVSNVADAERVAAAIARHPDVAYAERTRRLRAERVPNDPMFAQQFYLGAGSGTIDALSAWDVTLGSPAVVIAVLDTGWTPHADLAGRVLAGYDFVTRTVLSNDGDGRDADARDPGDWVSLEDLAGGLEAHDCTVRASSWHGTSVMGALAANGDNGLFLTGVDWRARILPVRVLGKCYGDDLDGADAIMWAAGLPVPGLPVNVTPAQVINLSLGDLGACPAFMQDSISAALAYGVTRAIVASAGNQNVATDHFPSSCDGVISVAATTSSGNRAGYSNYGPRIDIAAPGGSLSGVATGFLSLMNTGFTAPLADSTAFRSGTSFSAPLVSGVAALMLSVAPGLSAASLRDLIKASAKPFPATSTCAGLCGAGILDAGNAVRNARLATGGIPRAMMVEYYNAALDHYFMTWVADEIVLIDEGVIFKGWRRTGKSFEALLTATGSTAPVCRIYIPPAQGDGHYFGRDATECAGTLAANPTFLSEDPAFIYLYKSVAGVCTAGTSPVYRVFSNRPDANHRYTTERAIRDVMVARGWLAEGDGPDEVVMCAPAQV